MQNARFLTPVVACLLAFLAPNVDCLAQESPPEREPAAALAHAIRLLTNEARQAKEDLRLPRAEPDFASSYPDPVHPEMLAKRLTRPIDRDPFIDAYVRWQLTGFEAKLPEMNDREFERFAEGLPAMVPNPRADERLINNLQRAVDMGELTESQQEEVDERLNRMAKDTGTAKDLNLPAERLREWFKSQHEEDALRQILLAIEHAAALVLAGWTSDDMKQQVFELCERHRHDESLTDERRRELEQLANRLAGTSRLYVVSAGIRNNALAASFEETGIYDFDANRWMRALRDD